MSNRYKILSESDNECTMHIPADGDLFPAYTREFWAPSDGGYVYEIFEHRPGTSGQQVCDCLRDTGDTLHWDGSRPLIHMIRAEAKREQMAA